MPELLTKYPDIALKVLRESGVDCGTGALQQILTACPPDRFCSLPRGELCVYGLNEVQYMTQITGAELMHYGAVPQLASTQSIIFVIVVFLLCAIILYIKRRF